MLLLQRTQVQFLEPTSGSSRPSIAPILRDPMSSSGLQGYLYILGSHTYMSSDFSKILVSFEKELYDAVKVLSKEVRLLALCLGMAVGCMVSNHHCLDFSEKCGA